MAGYTPAASGDDKVGRFKTPTGQQDVPLLGGIVQVTSIHPIVPKKNWKKKVEKKF